MWPFGFYDDFDPFFRRPRKYTSALPEGYNPRRIAGGESSALTLTDRSALAGRDFFDDFWKNYSLGKYFIGFDEDMKTEEKPDKYVVSYAQKNINPEDVKVDFHKKENELVISMNHEEKDEHGSSSKTFTSTMKFEKPIKFDSIVANITDNGINLELPKVEPDKEEKDENVVSVNVSRKEKL